jgi:hypothetical protein
MTFADQLRSAVATVLRYGVATDADDIAEAIELGDVARQSRNHPARVAHALGFIEGAASALDVTVLALLDEHA